MRFRIIREDQIPNERMARIKTLVMILSVEIKNYQWDK